MQTDDIRRVLVVGAGTMGEQISLQCAMFGYDVALYDIQPQALERARTKQASILAGLVDQGQVTEETARQVVGRILFTTDPMQAAEGVDLLSEAVPENPELKARVLQQFHARCPPEAIFTTNTSFLLPSMLAAHTGRPAMFAALHFHLPVWYANIVDILPHSGTDPQVVEVLQAFARRIGQVPIVSRKERPGYVFNALLGVLNREAMTLVAEGVASPEDVDRAWMGVMKTPLGPFGIMDMVGLDTCYDITALAARSTDDAQLQRNAELLKSLIDQGWLGQKTGHGFYTYPDPAYARPDFVTGEPGTPGTHRD